MTSPGQKQHGTQGRMLSQDGRNYKNTEGFTTEGQRHRDTELSFLPYFKVESNLAPSSLFPCSEEKEESSLCLCVSVPLW
jgi:hypothetical protein